MRWPFKILGSLILIGLAFPIIETCKIIFGKKIQVSTASYYDEEFEARSAAERAVQSAMKAPSTARFIDQFASIDKKGNWNVAGSVDAQNSYGAMLRSKYHCTFRREGNAMRLVKLVFPI